MMLWSCSWKIVATEIVVGCKSSRPGSTMSRVQLSDEKKRNLSRAVVVPTEEDVESDHRGQQFGQGGGARY